jgi:hypothetical protein
MKKLTKEEIELFDLELKLLCEKHNVVLSHEDGHGGGLLRKASENDLPRCEFPIRLDNT